MTRTASIPEALAEAARWRLAALLLERPRRGWIEELRAVSVEAGHPVLARAVALAADATEGGYLALVGPGGAVAAREVAYRGGRDPGWLLADLARFYGAFGYRPAAEDPADHFAVEAGFVGYLWLKEALALSREDAAAAAVTREARTSFLADHLAGVTALFAAALRRAGDGGPLATAATAIAERLADVAPSIEVAAGHVDDDEGCAGCAGLPPDRPA